MAHDLDTATRTGREAATAGADETVPALTVLWHPEPRRVGERAPLLAWRLGQPLSRLEPGFAPAGRERRMPLGDPHLSRKPLTLRVRDGAIEIERGACKTAVTVDGEALGERLRIERDEAVLELAGRVALLCHPIDPAPSPRPRFFDLVGDSPAWLRLAQEVAAVAELDVPVLLRGETGTGKERIAACLHAASGRTGPFVAVNLGAVPANLAAAELFGAAKGAYTGADRNRRGHCLRADGGTLFLDEVGEAPPEVQVALLRTLETGRVLPVGGDTERAVDLRWIAATDAPLEARVEEGSFRAPLLHRLGGVVLRLPPLRERRDDIARLFLHFLGAELRRVGEADRLASDGGGWVPASLVAALVRAPWPGNVRQLQNVVRQLVVASRGRDVVRVPRAVEEVLGSAQPAAGEAERRRFRAAREVGDDEIRDALAAAGWRVKAAAEALGISRGALYRRIEASPRLRTGAALPAGEVRAAVARHDGDLDAAAAELEVSREALHRRLGRRAE